MAGRLAGRLAVLVLALLLDAGPGYPAQWIGRLIGVLDAGLNRGGWRRARGVACLGCLVGASWGWAALVGRAGRIGVLAGCASLLAQRSLISHVRAVARADGLAAGREAVSRIVGRDVGSLDTGGVARAAIESLAENFSDGVVAPAFWFAVAGLPGMAIYKGVNTADSMIGHLTSRHAEFGWASARLDDWVNLPASRLSSVLIGLVSPRPRASLRAVLRDARHHRSPNAGWPEAAMAGGLGLRLAGPRSYGGVEVADRWMGDGRVAAGREDMERAIGVAWRAWGLGLSGVVGLLGLSCGAVIRPPGRGRRGSRPSS